MLDVVEGDVLDGRSGIKKERMLCAVGGLFGDVFVVGLFVYAHLEGMVAVVLGGDIKAVFDGGGRRVVRGRFEGKYRYGCFSCFLDIDHSVELFVVWDGGDFFYVSSDIV